MWPPLNSAYEFMYIGSVFWIETSDQWGAQWEWALVEEVELRSFIKVKLAILQVPQANFHLKPEFPTCVISVKVWYLTHNA